MSKIYLERYYYKMQVNNKGLLLINSLLMSGMVVGYILLSRHLINMVLELNKFYDKYEMYTVISTIILLLILLLGFSVLMSYGHYKEFKDYKYKYDNYYELI